MAQVAAAHWRLEGFKARPGPPRSVPRLQAPRVLREWGLQIPDSGGKSSLLRHSGPSSFPADGLDLQRLVFVTSALKLLLLVPHLTERSSPPQRCVGCALLDSGLGASTVTGLVGFGVAILVTVVAVTLGAPWAIHASNTKCVTWLRPPQPPRCFKAIHASN